MKKSFFSSLFFLIFVRIRGVGTAAINMCLVATGVADAYYEMGIHCWDMAGAGIIVTEAGGVLMDVTGKIIGQ